jgi:hypothetical protein
VLHRRSFGKTEIDGECRLLGCPHTAEMSKEREEEEEEEEAFISAPITSSLNPIPHLPFELRDIQPMSLFFYR